MKQAFHIFKKDLRALWIPIGTVLALHIVYCILRVREPNPQKYLHDSGPAGTVAVMLVLGWFSVIAAAMHEEPLPGVRQFWLTRPYSLRSLVGAKLLLCLAVMNLPLLVSDVVLLSIHGLPVVGPALLVRQIESTSTFIAPAFVLGVISSTTAGFWTSLFAAIVALLSSSMAVQAILFGNTPVGMGVEIGGGVGSLLLAAVLFVWWQYSRRQTRAGRVVVFGVLLALPFLTVLPWLGGASEERLPPAPAEYARLKFTYEPQRSARTNVRQPSAQFVRVDVPVSVEGVPAGEDVQASSSSGEISAQGTIIPVRGALLVRTDEGYWQELLLEPTVFERLNSTPVSVKAEWTVLVRSGERLGSIRPGTASFVPGIGQCRIVTPESAPPAVGCLVGPQRPAWIGMQLVSNDGAGHIPSETGFRSDDDPAVVGGISPIDPVYIALQPPDWLYLQKVLKQPGTRVDAFRFHSKARFRREMSIDGVNLARYRVE